MICFAYIYDLFDQNSFNCLDLKFNIYGAEKLKYIFYLYINFR